MLALLTLSVLAQAADDEHLAAIRTSLEKTASSPYAYEVRGRFERAGEWHPPGVLTSRVKQYQSARNGERLLVKGPEGLWLTAEERLGEKVERPDPLAADVVRGLQGADAPHRIVARWLEEVTRGRAPEEREIEGTPCLRYSLYYTPTALRRMLEAHLEKSIAAGNIAKPDEVRWASGLKGTLRVYVVKKDGRLLRAVEERSVKIAYKVPDQAPDVKTYKLETELVLSAWGTAELRLPPEVKDRLGL
ncbi:MAG TPA: hypothetical protein VEJ18_16345 [Planctomycetota bacterium]|nr:hypothetical protein [Planctomycetota bacterium]